MLIDIARFLRASEAVTVSLSREPTGHLRLLVQPKLGPEPDKLADDAKQLRAALARPLIITVRDEDLDTLPATIAQAASSRDETASALEAYIDGQRKSSSGKAAQKPAAATPAAPKAEPKAEPTAAPEAPPAAPAVNLTEGLE